MLDQLDASGVPIINVVGGAGAVSHRQVAALEAAGYDVTRLAGANRYETNAKVIDAAGPSPEKTAFIATGDGVPVGTLEALRNAGVEQAIIVGGEEAVNDSAVADLGRAGIEIVERLSGDSRVETAIAVATYGIANLGLDDEGATFASGAREASGADALSCGVLSGRQGRPVLITKSDVEAGDALLEYVASQVMTMHDGLVLGGESAVSLDVQHELEMLLSYGFEPAPEPR